VELYFGGWAAPNIYYIGSSGIIDLKITKEDDLGNQKNFSLTIGGISGIE
jgi:hypothetical protein